MDTLWSAPPVYAVDLDQPPRERWKHIVADYMPELTVLVEYFNTTEREEYGRCAGSVIRSVGSVMSQIHTDGDLCQELQGIAELTAGIGLTYDRLLLLNCGYDVLARCTSAVVSSPGGAPAHLRNMDWDAEAFWPLTMQVEFQRGGETVFSGVGWAGFVGL